MKNLFITLMMAVMLMPFVKSFGQPTVYPPFGCKSASTQIVYYDWLGTSDNGKYVFKGYPTYSITPYTWDASAMDAYPCYRWIPYETPMGCKIKTSSSSAVYETGERGYFAESSTYCTLDDYLCYLILPVMFCGFFYIRSAALKLIK